MFNYYKSFQQIFYLSEHKIIYFKLLFLIFIVVSNHLTLAIVADYSTIPKGTNPTLYDTHDYVVQLDDQSFNETVFCLNSNSNNLFLDENEINNNLTKQSFSSISGETEINGHCTSFIVEFYSDWCGHCRTYSRLYKALANDLLAWKGVLKLAAINCADPVNIDTCRDSSITHYPLLKYFPRNSIENNLNSNITVGQPLRSYQSLAQMRDQITRIILTEYEANRYEDWPKFEWLDEVETYNQLWKDIDSHISTLVVLFEANTDSLVGAQLLLDLSSYADKVVARRCVNTALANALQINDFPTFAVFRRGERYPLHIAELRRLLFNEFEQLLLNNNNKESKKLANKFFSRRKLNNNNNSVSENHKLFCENFPQICRRDFFVSELDLLKSARIALFNDVQMIGSDYISGENLTALNDFHFPHRTIHPQFMRKNKEIDSLLNSKEEIIGTSSEKENIEFLNASSRARAVFSSSPVLRGYTCGLWTLFHVLTVNGYRNGEKGKFDPLNILFSIRNWVLSFFTCEYCRIHFRKMTTKIAKIESSILRNEDLFLYLWKAHNIVNSRLNGKETEDPKFPKYQFPPKFLCQECRKKGEEDNDLFEEDKIKNFLLLFYSDIRPIGAKSVEDEVEEIEKRLE